MSFCIHHVNTIYTYTISKEAKLYGEVLFNILKENICLLKQVKEALTTPFTFT